MAHGAVSSLGEGNTPVIQSLRIGLSPGPAAVVFQIRELQSFRFVQRPLQRSRNGLHRAYRRTLVPCDFLG